MYNGAVEVYGKTYKIRRIKLPGRELVKSRSGLQGPATAGQLDYIRHLASLKQVAPPITDGLSKEQAGLLILRLKTRAVKKGQRNAPLI